MKKPLLYLLFFIYSVSLMKPVMPYIADGMAHLFFYSGHITTVHKEHGKYHVHHELAQASKKNFPLSSNDSSKKAGNENDCILYLAAGTSLLVFIKNSSLSYPFQLPGKHLQFDSPPPRC